MKILLSSKFLRTRWNICYGSRFIVLRLFVIVRTKDVPLSLKSRNEKCISIRKRTRGILARSASSSSLAGSPSSTTSSLSFEDITLGFDASSMDETGASLRAVKWSLGHYKELKVKT
ncbi:40S ribosomal protein S1 [Striga asiatica]|uniref:40S ribosomal protein S1 n=1 Tax=Striga asiatica TaxID=4170 RepID=A0A5A7Q4K2_STRAF|nr:40S ribosomal protein S1 [Striga asiatica]